MSFWYDLKQKAYSTDKNNSWLKAYADRIVSLLRGEITTTLNSHFSGESSRHSAGDIDLASGENLEQNLENETTERLSGDAALSASISAEAAERKEADAQKVDKIDGKGLSTNDYTNAEKEKLAGIAAGAEINSVISVAGKTGTVTLSKSDVGLDNADNTADIDKPISTAVQNALDLKADISSLNNKADVSAVLTKTNTDAFTPTANYQPATKKYVDDSISNAGGGDMMRATYDTDGSGVVDNAEKLGGNEPSYYASAAEVSDKAPTSHASSGTTYGVGTASNYGHLKLADNLSTTSASGIALSAKQGKILNEKIAELSANSPTIPTIAAACADGTLIGSDAWTGTGFFCTAENTRYTAPDTIESIAGFNRFCLKVIDTLPIWKSWTPYLDYNGETYEFFYSTVRGLYETLIPETGMTPEQIVAAIRWEYCPPSKLKYGKLSNGLGYYNYNGTNYLWGKYENGLRDSSAEVSGIDSDIYACIAGTKASGYSIADGAQNPFSYNKTFWTLCVLLGDVRYLGSFAKENISSFSSAVMKGIPFPIEICDNF